MIIFKKSRTFLILAIIFFITLLGWFATTGILKNFMTGKPIAAKEKSPEDIAKEGTPQDEVITVKVYRVVLRDFTDTIPVVGYVKGSASIELKFEVPGRITAINFKEGDLIKKGDVIANIDQRDAQLKLEYNEAKYKNAAKQYEAASKRFQQYDELYKIGSIIKLKYEEARAENEAAEAQLESAQKEMEVAQVELDKTNLKSYVDGVLGSLSMDVGDYVSTAYSTKFGELFTLDTVNVELGIVEKDIEKIKLGQKVKINVDACPGVDFEGTLDNIVPMIEGKSRTLTAKVTLQNAEGRLLPGMFARATIYIFEEKNTIVIPNTALYDLDGDGKFDSVFLVDTEKVAHAKQVKPGYMTSDYAQILEGLAEEDSVVIEAQGQLKDGSKVEVIETEEAAAGAEESKPPTAPVAEQEGPK